MTKVPPGGLLAEGVEYRDSWASLDSRTENWILYAVGPDGRYAHWLDREDCQ